ncbi:hypothetical protein FOMPIDRAFT_82654 [Fomitopsis schrenkii]|uniref:Cytochrome P450 n=1 Tax=Fomitopsis schrenkii TaxID=2126942 RepID=S8E3U2_FOMSC|nr:hypothetical protein FOMPIDRAFT_82654 [Fomitopsis schrenkii]
MPPISLASIYTTTMLKSLGLVLIAFVLKPLFSYVRMRIAMRHMRYLPGPFSPSLLSGNITTYLSRNSEDFHKEIALDHGSVVRLTGPLGEPILYISDPKALHTVLIKDEPIFQESEEFMARVRFVFGTTLLKQRKILNPIFSINNMRGMLPIFYEIGNKARGPPNDASLRDGIAAQIRSGNPKVDVLGWMGRTALELIGQGGLGYSFDPLVEESKDTYADALKAMLPNLDDTARYHFMIPAIQRVVPKWILRAIVDIFPAHTSVGRTRDTVDTMFERAESIYADKKRAFEAGDAAVEKQTGQGKDITSILMRANASAEPSQRLADDEVISLMSMFIFAATDTTSNALARIITMLATRTDYQDKLRLELLAANAADGISYDDLNRLPLLDSVIRETLRLYPPAPTNFRVCHEDTVLPLSKAIRTTDGKQTTSIFVPRGSKLLVGIIGCNWSKSLWGEDALEWKPERWLSPLPSTVSDAHVPGVYSNIMTFSGGKRGCIGLKFSELEMKVVLSILLSTFTFELTDKPIKWNVASVWFPTAGDSDTLDPELPLNVKLYKAATS